MSYLGIIDNADVAYYAGYDMHKQAGLGDLGAKLIGGVRKGFNSLSDRVGRLFSGRKSRQMLQGEMDTVRGQMNNARNNMVSRETMDGARRNISDGEGYIRMGHNYKGQVDNLANASGRLAEVRGMARGAKNEMQDIVNMASRNNAANRKAIAEFDTAIGQQRGILDRVRQAKATGSTAERNIGGNVSAQERNLGILQGQRDGVLAGARADSRAAGDLYNQARMGAPSAADRAVVRGYNKDLAAIERAVFGDGARGMARTRNTLGDLAKHRESYLGQAADYTRGIAHNKNVVNANRQFLRDATAHNQATQQYLADADRWMQGAAGQMNQLNARARNVGRNILLGTGALAATGTGAGLAMA